MLIAGRTLFAFVDLKDPFMPSGIEGEGEPGPVLSMLGARAFDTLVLFHTPQTAENAEATVAEAGRRYPGCKVMARNLGISDPKDYSRLMGRLGREVRSFLRETHGGETYVCVSSGTAEMRAAWFLLVATGVLPARMLQLGSPAAPLFGAANVREVEFGRAGWEELRDLLMPREYFERSIQFSRPTTSAPPPEDRTPLFALDSSTRTREDWAAPLPSPMAREEAPAEESELEVALQELGIFTGSAAMRQAAERAAIAASESDVPILLTGETGTVKEMFAKLVHRLSTRRTKSMVSINCAAIPRDLAESHLFGHVKGAFTGAVQKQEGMFAQAHGSTLFLDEVGELTLESQAKLLRVLQDGVIEPVGSGKPRTVDVRIVAATNRNMKEEIAAGRFREDLYFRLEVVRVELPPLRQRRGEIAALALALLKQINDRREKPRELSTEALRALEAHHWPGNVRELSNVLERAALFARDGVIRAHGLELPAEEGDDLWHGLPEPRVGFSMKDYLAETRKRLVERALELTGGNQSAAAELLGVSKQAVSKALSGKDDNGN
jgi:two-component system response regulator HydG